MDAFGNAIGNSIIEGLSRKKRISVEDQSNIQEISAKLSKATQEGVTNTLEDTLKEKNEANTNDAADKTNGNIVVKDVADSSLGLTDKSGINAYSDALNDYGNYLEDKSKAQIAGIHQSADEAYEQGKVSGYRNSVRNREQIGFDFTDINEGLDKTLAFFDAERKAFDNSFVGKLGNAVEDGIEITSNVIKYGFSGFITSKPVLENVFVPIDIVTSEIVDNGGFTYAFGATAGYESGASLDGSLGNYISVNFRTGNINIGYYDSIEFGANLSPLVPEAHAGLENILYTSPDFKGALRGNFTVTGVTGEAGIFGLDYGKVSASGGTITGHQFTGSLSVSPKIKLPSGSIYYHGGRGEILEIYETNYKNWFNKE